MKGKSFLALKTFCIKLLRYLQINYQKFFLIVQNLISQKGLRGIRRIFEASILPPLIKPESSKPTLE